MIRIKCDLRSDFESSSEFFVHHCGTWNSFTVRCFPWFPIEGVCFQGLHGATSLEFAHGGFAVSNACSWEVIQSWISLDAILLAQWLSFLGSAVNLDNIKLSFGFMVKVFPGWSKFLAVATPWCVKLEIGEGKIISTQEFFFIK